MRWKTGRALLAMFQIVVLLSVQLAEGTGVHHCPEHDAGVGAGPAEMAGHMGHHGASHDREHASCHCVGVCCQATLTFAPASPVAMWTAATLSVRPSSVAVVSLRTTVRLLPFSIGPPLVA